MDGLGKRLTGLGSINHDNTPNFPGELPLRVFLTINHEEFEEDSSQAKPVPATPDSLLARPRIKLYSGKLATRGRY